MRYPDNLTFTPSHQMYSDPTRTPPLLAAKPQPQPTNEAIINHLIRIETRLVKLMYHVGLDANGRTRDEG